MSDAAHPPAGGGGEGMNLPTKILLTLLAAGVGLAVLGVGWQMLGSGGASFLQSLDRAIEDHPRSSQLVLLFFLGISGALVLVNFRK